MGTLNVRKVLPIFFVLLFFLVFIGINYSVYSLFITKASISLIVSLLALGIILGSRIIKTNYGKLTHYIRNIVNFYVGAIFIFFVFSIIFRVVALAGLSYNLYYYSVVSSIATLYAMYSSQEIIRKEYVITSKKVKRKYTIVHISDIHIGSNHRITLNRVVDMVNLIKADFIFITGDLVDENVTYEDIKSINSFTSKPYFIYGNHEHYVNQENLSKILSKLNLTILHDKSILNKDFQIIGIDDTSNLSKVLSEIPVSKKKFSILLNHQPSSITFVQSKGIDLMLSGHTHGGQIWPFNYLVRMQFKIICGFHKIKNLHLNVSPGTGTWGPKMRLATTNEISVIKVVPGKESF